MKLFKQSLVALALSAAAGSVMADSLAIINATVHTATEQGVLENASVIIDNGHIVAVNPANVEADQVIDAQGKILTPGLIGSMNQLGLVEVSAVAGSRDGNDDKAGITFDASTAFNPMSTAIPFARKGGITRDVVAPGGGKEIFSGQLFAVDLSGEFDSVIATGSGLYVELGAKSKGSRAIDMATLFNKLEDTQKKLAKAAEDDKDKDPSREEQVLAKVLAGDMPLLVDVDRASDILQVLKLKEQFSVDLVLVSAADAVVVAEQISAAEVPVLIGAMRNLPGNFDSMHTSLESAAKLDQAGVKVGLAVADAHGMYQLRFTAGNAVANGLDADAALKAVTANLADIFNLDAGVIAEGKAADLVLWSADPFELSTKVEKMWIAGEETSTESRHDKLRDRYTTDAKMPRAYTK